ncbi:hypothetical protein [Coralloluteibacterium stylophorae]|uniref:Nucleotidyltransferase family protein n=1 Tax=Coralloluteibacterium stylophorae TaxID=1776034 RepID=A0A8J8AWE1_9GAMM|nr:hypothetical protein [Coralloluteibacterium stylophorae]MBS7457679.1 hypothetical protein [Coralloluteibacterium stylophorae]
MIGFDPASLLTFVWNYLPWSVRMSAFLGGGAFRSLYDQTTIKDFDLFFPTHGDFLAARDAFDSDEEFSRVENEGDALYPCYVHKDLPNTPFNLIGFRHHADMLELAESFDFRCCGFAGYVFAGEAKFCAVPGAEDDARDRKLRVMNPQAAPRFLRRARRYVETYGYDFIDETLIDSRYEVYARRLPQTCPQGHPSGSSGDR